MKRKQSLLFSLTLLLMISTSARAQLWSGIIDPSRAIDWSNVGIPGGIPNRTTICATLNPGATATQINSAIASCPSGQVVYLNAGTYNLSSGIDFSGSNNVTLRGAGPDQTKLVFTGAVGCELFPASICVAGSSRSFVENPAANGGGSIHNWTAGYSQGTTILTFDSVSGWAVNQMLVLDQFDDDPTDTGGVTVNGVEGLFIQEGLGPGRYCPNAADPGCGATSGSKPQQEFKVITAINGNQVTISPPLYMPNWRAAKNPQGWTPGVIGSGIGTMLGVEALTVDTTNDGSAASSNIEIGNCYKCWVKNVRSINANRNHIWLVQASRAVVRDSYFYGTKNSASQSYGVESYMAGDNLIENNIFQHVTTPLMLGNNYGSVYAYNYTIDSFFGSPAGYMAAAIFSNHDVTGMNLFEGNDVNQVISDNIHGTSNLATFFRNRVRGWDTQSSGAPPTAATWVFNIMAYNRFTNIIGNVLGTSGVHTVYQEIAPSGSANCSTDSLDVYLLGYKTGCVNAGIGSIQNDPLTSSTIVRWGNYDVVSGAAQFNCSEVDPAGAVPFSNANACPGNRNFPSSFYLASKPGFWGTMPWPPIGPDVTGGSGPGGFAHTIPAQVCYNNTPKDSNGILIFNANKCYGQQPPPPPPAPPSNLRAVVQ